MTLITITDAERNKLLRTVAHRLGLSVHATTPAELERRVEEVAEKADRYEDLCK